jgi:hypothetical protein
LQKPTIRYQPLRFWNYEDTLAKKFAVLIIALLLPLCGVVVLQGDLLFSELLVLLTAVG